MTKRWKRRVGHVPHGVSYAVENSNWFTTILHLLGLVWVDKDAHVTKDGVVVFGHWGRIKMNQFVLPKWFKDKYGINPRISDVLWADLAKLRTKPILFRGKYRRFKFTDAYTAFRVAASRGRAIMIEQKGDRPFRTREVWDELEMQRRQAGLPANHLVAATLPNMAGAREMLMAAMASGRQTMVIRAQDGVPRSWAPYMTWYRGAIRWVNR